VSSGRGSDVLELLERRGAVAYLGEPVTLLEHVLQCAQLAASAGEEPALVAACLLHDVGWLLGETRVDAGSVAAVEAAGRGDRERASRDQAERPGHDHAERGAAALAAWFPPTVFEPVRLHIQAKRWIVANEPGALERLSVESRRTLVLQGGPLDAVAASAFTALPYSDSALRLRRYDDSAKDPRQRRQPLGEYIQLLDGLARDADQNARG
jgi:predicted HD phosphohydrolase